MIRAIESTVVKLQDVSFVLTKVPSQMHHDRYVRAIVVILFSSIGAKHMAECNGSDVLSTMYVDFQALADRRWPDA